MMESCVIGTSWKSRRRGQRQYIACRPTAWIVENDAGPKLHGQAIAGREMPDLVAHGDVHLAFQHPDLLMGHHAANGVVEGDGLSSRETHLDQFDRRTPAKG